MSPKRRAVLFSLATACLASVAACAAPSDDSDPGMDSAEVVGGAFGDYNTPDRGNRWLKGVDVSTLTKGEESRLANEDAMFDQLVDRIEGFQQQLVDQGINQDVIRAFHAKTQACVRGEFQVKVPAGFTAAKVGVFANDASYPVWLRLSNGVAYFQKDKEVDVRGLAMKIMDVPGPKLNPGQETSTTQDFIAINTPTSFTTDAVSLIDFVEVTVAAKLQQQRATDWASGVLSHLPLFVPKDALAERFGMLAGMVGPGGYLVKPGNERLLAFLLSKLVPATWKQGSLLGARFWSQSAFAMGVDEGDPMTAQAREAAKLVFEPGVVVDASAPGAQQMPDGAWCQSTPKTPDTADDNYLHTNLATQMKQRDTCIVVKMQLQTDPVHQLIEDTTVEWQERDSPFTTVGFVRVPKVNLDDPSLGSKQAFCNNLAFTPWHALPDHRPLGNFQRARLKVYNALAVKRGAMADRATGALVEPTSDQFRD